jgi:cyclic pyranopterin phosphate synthase
LLFDRFNRKIEYLRISVTDRCNLRCCYCMPPEGVELLKHEDILSVEEIVEITKAAVAMGITKVRLTGGEPLTRRGIVELVRAIGAIDGIGDFAMTTNGTLLSEYAQSLAEAGLHRVNISIDTIDPDRYKKITRLGSVERVFAGIEAARSAGLAPIKLNCVIGEFSHESDAESVREFGRKNGIAVRIIRQMTFETGSFSVIEGGSGGDCPRCNRLRLSSDGKIRPCLFSDLYFDVRSLGACEAIRQALAQKPDAGGSCLNAKMHRIGG